MSVRGTQPKTQIGRAAGSQEGKPNKTGRSNRHEISESVERAYHEAGHALAAYLTGRHFRTLSILDGEHSHEQFAARPWAAFAPEKCTDLAHRDRVERNIIELFAGDMAEEILTGKSVERGESSDFHQVSELGACVMETGEVLDAYLHYMALRTKHLLSLPQNWDAIQLLADELVRRKRLDYNEARKILDEAIVLGLEDLMHHGLGINRSGSNHQPRHRQRS